MKILKSMFFATLLTTCLTLHTQQTKTTQTLPSIGNRMICPVMKKEIEINNKTPNIEFEGKRYYLCCDKAVEIFKKEPQRYSSNSDLPIGNKLICPVMKREFTPTSKSPKIEYKGKIYYFCCEGCIDEFKKEPEKYIVKKKNKSHQHKKGKGCKFCNLTDAETIKE